MKFFPSRRVRRLSTVALLLVLPVLWGHAELADWVRDLEVNTRLERIFFQPVPLPQGTVPIRRTSEDTRKALSRWLVESPGRADLYSLRALEAERQLDFSAAEADWKKYAELAEDRAAGLRALADFYHRRLQPRHEVEALLAAARHGPSESDALLPPAEQEAWRIFRRILSLLEAHSFPEALTRQTYQGWLDRYPNQAGVYEQYFEFLLEQEDYKEAQELIASYQGAFPEDQVFPVKAQASLARTRGSREQALAFYNQAFEPLWPPELVESYFRLLREAGKLRAFLDSARASLAADPADLKATARVFYYYQQQRNSSAAQQPLMEFLRSKEAQDADWMPQELYTLARLFEDARNYDEAARYYYALYSLRGTDEAEAEQGLAGLINILFAQPERPVRLGSSDLSLYRDIGTFDPYPGFLNGLLSLVFNSVNPKQHHASQERSAVAYFHRARASELLTLFDRRFPESKKRPRLHVHRLQAYATYGEDGGVIRGAREFLDEFPQAPQRTEVALLLAESLARQGRTQEEFAAYDRLLRELANRAGGVPLGLAGQPRRAGRRFLARAARSPEYARVLDRYIARLVSMKRILDALALYRREIDRNPDDPGLYERLASFLEQNRLGDHVEQVYRRAMHRFSDRSWHHKLARWYLRQRREWAFGQLTREVIRVFSGSELEDYFNQVVVRRQLAPQLYLQVNRFAHQRFPHNLTFVRNLLAAYRTKATRNDEEWERLLRRHWFYADDLRSRFFEFLSRERRLSQELQAVRDLESLAEQEDWVALARSNPAVAYTLAEGEIWRSHFEAAAPVLLGLAEPYPTDEGLIQRVADLHRSLAAFEPRYTETAATVEENLQRYRPRDPATLTRIGEIYADRNRFDRAQRFWDRIARIEPGKPDGYLEAATLYWDYFRFDDALRLLNEGRQSLGNDTLFAYEAGAIYENKRAYEPAVQEYLKGALAEPHDSSARRRDSSARRRLLRLAGRPKLRDLVEEATAEAVAGANPPVTAVSLRAAVLQGQERRDELHALLLRLARETSSWDLLEFINDQARSQAFDDVRIRSLRRQVGLTSDPVNRLRLRLSLARLHESQENFSAAREAYQNLYGENSRILGIVRAAVDFYWRRKNHSRAIQILLEAAGRSYPELKERFLFEAARRSTEAGQYAEARELLSRLREEHPFSSDYLAGVAEAYAREGDDAGLRDFYLATIKELKEAPLPPEQRTARVAALRRGLIPALDRLGDPVAAVDQYIEIINRYPEDEDLIKESSYYAERHNLAAKLIRYYQKTADASPRDYRWPMVLARLEMHFEHFAEAVAAYERAAQIRPDRIDLHIARASLEERLRRWDDALQSYRKLYELSYQDPQWMEKVALLHARQGRPKAVGKALRKAFLEGQPERPEQFFAIARRLATWDFLVQAREFAERGVEGAGEDLLISQRTGARDYAGLLTRLRDYRTAYARLLEAHRPGFRSHSGLVVALREMGRTVKRDFTPEEKVAFSTFLEEKKAGMKPEDWASTLVPVAQEAGLAELEAAWQFELMMAWPGQKRGEQHERRFRDLQERRMQHAELARKLEEYWSVYPRDQTRASVLQRAALAYRDAGQGKQELRVLALLEQENRLGGEFLERYFELLYERDPDLVVSLAGQSRFRDAAANFLVARGDPQPALSAMPARGASRRPVWSPAYTALVGLHYALDSAAVDSAFLQILREEPIGERIGEPVDRDQQLAGDIWFYYGARYGEYLELFGRPAADDYLPAELEHTPGRAEAYVQLADYFREAGELERALVDYDHALELDPDQADAHARAAEIHWQKGAPEEAVVRWRAALAAYHRQQNKGRVTESFWSGVRRTLLGVGRYDLLSSVREEADRLLRTYVRRNGTYRVEPLLEAAFAAAQDPAAGARWIADLAEAANDTAGFLEQVVKANWLPEAQQEVIYRNLLVAARKRVEESYGPAQRYAESTLHDWQIRWVTYLLDTGRVARARKEFDRLLEPKREILGQRLSSLEIHLAAHAGTLDSLLETYQREPQKSFSPAALRQATDELRREGREAAVRRLLEFLYAGALAQHEFSTANFLGLAKVRLEQKRLDDALSLLRRMTMVAGRAFENLEAAASLLEETGHPGEAMEFRTLQVEVEPWNETARLALANTLLAAGRNQKQAVETLRGLVGASGADYETRAKAALRLGETDGAAPIRSRGELNLLVSGTMDPQAAQQAHFYPARMEAARAALDPDVQAQLLLDALAVRPEGNEARVLLLRPAVQTGRYPQAVAAMEPWIEQSGLRYHLRRFRGEGDTEIVVDDFMAERFLSNSTFSPARRAEAAAALATAFQKLGQLGAAEFMLKLASKLEPSGEKLRLLKERARAVAAGRRRRAENEARRPIIHEPLEQDRRVRPRLEADPGEAGGNPQ